MSNCCCVPNCGNDFKSGVRIFRFPKDAMRRNQWAEVIKASPNLMPTENSRICEAHFKPSEIHTKDGKGVLKKGAMPSIFPRGKKALMDHDYGYGDKTSQDNDSITDDPLSLEATIKNEPLDFQEDLVIKEEEESLQTLEPEVVLNVKKEPVEEEMLMPTITNSVSMAPLSLPPPPAPVRKLPLHPELKVGAPPEPMTKNPPVFAKIFLCPLCEGGKHPPQFGSLNGAQSHLWTFHRIPKRGQKLLEDAGITILEKK